MDGNISNDKTNAVSDFEQHSPIQYSNTEQQIELSTAIENSTSDTTDKICTAPHANLNKSNSNQEHNQQFYHKNEVTFLINANENELNNPQLKLRQLSPKLPQYTSTANLNIVDTLEQHNDLEQLNKKYNDAKKLGEALTLEKNIDLGTDNAVFEMENCDNHEVSLSDMSVPDVDNCEQMTEAVNLELLNLKPLTSQEMQRTCTTEANIPVKKQAELHIGDQFEDYFVPVNEHKKYMRGEKLYVTMDKRTEKGCGKCFCWGLGLALLMIAIVIGILAATGLILNNESENNAVSSRQFGNSKIESSELHDTENEKNSMLDAKFNQTLLTALSTSSSAILEKLNTKEISSMSVPRAIEGVVKIDNREFTPDLKVHNSSEFRKLADKLEAELTKAIFDQYTLNNGPAIIRVNVVEFTAGSINAKFRITWTFKAEAHNDQDPINEQIMKNKLYEYLKMNFNLLADLHIHVNSIRIDRVLDLCKIDKNKCEHECFFDYLKSDFECSCPDGQILKDRKSCKFISLNNEQTENYSGTLFYDISEYETLNSSTVHIKKAVENNESKYNNTTKREETFGVLGTNIPDYKKEIDLTREPMDMETTTEIKVMHSKQTTKETEIFDVKTTNIPDFLIHIHHTSKSIDRDSVTENTETATETNNSEYNNNTDMISVTAINESDHIIQTHTIQPDNQDTITEQFKTATEIKDAKNSQINNKLEIIIVNTTYIPNVSVTTVPSSNHTDHEILTDYNETATEIKRSEYNKTSIETQFVTVRTINIPDLQIDNERNSSPTQRVSVTENFKTDSLTQNLELYETNKKTGNSDVVLTNIPDIIETITDETTERDSATKKIELVTTMKDLEFKETNKNSEYFGVEVTNIPNIIRETSPTSESTNWNSKTEHESTDSETKDTEYNQVHRKTANFSSVLINTPNFITESYTTSKPTDSYSISKIVPADMETDVKNNTVNKKTNIFGFEVTDIPDSVNKSDATSNFTDWESITVHNKIAMETTDLEFKQTNKEKEMFSLKITTVPNVLFENDFTSEYAEQDSVTELSIESDTRSTLKYKNEIELISTIEPESIERQNNLITESNFDSNIVQSQTEDHTESYTELNLSQISLNNKTENPFESNTVLKLNNKSDSSVLLELYTDENTDSTFTQTIPIELLENNENTSTMTSEMLKIPAAINDTSFETILEPTEFQYSTMSTPVLNSTEKENAILNSNFFSTKDIFYNTTTNSNIPEATYEHNSEIEHVIESHLKKITTAKPELSFQLYSDNVIKSSTIKNYDLLPSTISIQNNFSMLNLETTTNFDFVSETNMNKQLKANFLQTTQMNEKNLITKTTTINTEITLTEEPRNYINYISSELPRTSTVNTVIKLTTDLESEKENQSVPSQIQIPNKNNNGINVKNTLETLKPNNETSPINSTVIDFTNSTMENISTNNFNMSSADSNTTFIPEKIMLLNLTNYNNKSENQIVSTLKTNNLSHFNLSVNDMDTSTYIPHYINELTKTEINNNIFQNKQESNTDLKKEPKNKEIELENFNKFIHITEKIITTRNETFKSKDIQQNDTSLLDPIETTTNGINLLDNSMLNTQNSSDYYNEKISKENTSNFTKKEQNYLKENTDFDVYTIESVTERLENNVKSTTTTEETETTNNVDLYLSSSYANHFTTEVNSESTKIVIKDIHNNGDNFINETFMTPQSNTQNLNNFTYFPNVTNSSEITNKTLNLDNSSDIFKKNNSPNNKVKLVPINIENITETVANGLNDATEEIYLYNDLLASSTEQIDSLEVSILPQFNANATLSRNNIIVDKKTETKNINETVLLTNNDHLKHNLNNSIIPLKNIELKAKSQQPDFDKDTKISEKKILKKDKIIPESNFENLYNFSKCAFGQFRCVNGTSIKDASYCIPRIATCDSVIDCSDGSDEMTCFDEKCKENYQCKNDQCIKYYAVCDGIINCSDGSDEENCECTVEEFECHSGGCINKSERCDGTEQCPDRSDEWNCLQINNLLINNTHPLIDSEDYSYLSQMFLQVLNFDSQWHYVCSDNWNVTYSDMACQYLGYTQATNTGYINVDNITNNINLLTIDSASAKPISKLLSLFRHTNSCKKIVSIECEEFTCSENFFSDSKSPSLIDDNNQTYEQWPSVTLLYNQNKNIVCTGSLITPRWVLAGYKCIHGEAQPASITKEVNNWILYAGGSYFNIKNKNISGDFQTRKLLNIVPHPQIKHNLRYSNNIVLIELESSVLLNTNTNAICLPEKRIEHIQSCRIAGWGANNQEGTQINQYHRYLPVPFINISDCNSTTHYNGKINTYQMCSGYTDIEKASCLNDEGAPIMCFNNLKNRWELQGVLSHHENCGHNRHPAIFTLLQSDIRKWISNTIGTMALL